MDKKKHQVRYMDFVGRPKPSQAATAQVSPNRSPSASTGPIRPVEPSAARPLPKRPLSRPSLDFVAPRPAKNPASHPAKQPVETPTPPRIVQTTTVQTIAATDDRVESFEFGVIEDLSPVVTPEPEFTPGSRAATRESAAEAPSVKTAEAAKPTPSKYPAGKSPFLSSINVTKRPLSASAPTGINAPKPAKSSSISRSEKSRKKRKNAPFIVIVLLSILLGVSLGALVYFVLPH